MANEFVIKNGYFSQGNSNISGSLIVSASGTANDLLIGTNKLFVSASGNVGIGTTSPAGQFEVFTSLHKRFLIDYPSIYKTSLNFGSVGTLSYDGLDANLDINNGDATYGNTRFYSGATERMRIAAGGNVGIGNSTPSYKLTVQTSEPTFGIVQAISNNNGGNATSGSKILWDQSGIGNFWEGMPGGVNAWAVGLYNGSTNPEYLRIGSTGNVGIGITSPSVKLHVSGGITSTDTIAIAKGASDTVQQGSSVYLIGGSGSSYTQLQQGVGRFTIWGYNGSAWGEKFTINNTSGNVGIGTASPNSKLDVAGSINIASGLGNASTRPTIAAGTLTAGEIRAYSTDYGNLGDDGFVRISAGGGTNTNIKSYIDITGYSTVADMNKNIVLGTSGVERMRIDANGNVGIGTSTPTQKLSVATGSITADDYYFNNIPNIAVARRYVGGVVGISNAGYTTICNVDGDSLASGIRIALMGTGYAVVVNVVADILVNHYQDIYIESKSGIYTLLTLKVISDGNQSFTIQATTDSANAITLNVEVFPLNSETITFNPGSTYSGTTLIHPCVPGLNISATGGDASTNGNLSVSGRIGIGTTAPNAKLDVNGNTIISGSLTVASTNTGPTNILLVGSTVGNGSIAIKAASTVDYAYQTFYQGNVGKFEMGIVPTTSDYYINPNLQNGSTGAAIYIKKSDGNVGIGTTSPSDKLHVNGGVIISGSYGGIKFDNPIGESAGLTFKSNGNNIWSINKGAGDGTENWNFYNFYRGATDFSVNNLTGNVGIGTTTPGSYKLNVVGGPTSLDELQYTKAIFKANNTNYDTITDAGFYNWYSTTTAYNAPTTGWFYVTVERHSGDATWVHQTATSFGIEAGGINENVTYSRVRNGSTGWSKWKELVGTNITTGVTAISTGSLSVPGDISMRLGDSLRATGYAYSKVLETGYDGTLTQDYLNIYSAGNGANNATPKITILRDGNVGIGTTNPIWKFAVSKAGGIGLEIDPDSGTPGKVGMYAYNRSTTAYVPLQFEASQYIFSTGNVGIGTTSPYSLTNYTILTIGDNSASKIGLIKLRSNYNSGDGAEIYQSSTGTIFVNSNSSTSAMTLLSSGNVGIGTTSPGEKLDVSGNIKSSGIVYAAAASGFANTTYATNQRNPIWRFGNADGYGLSYFQGTSGLNGADTIGFHFGTATAATSLLQLNAGSSVTVNGSVAIGTTAPGSYKLNVVGGTTSLDQLQYTKGIPLTGINLNSITDAGFYSVNNVTNAPLGNLGYFYLTVERFTTSNWVHQTATSFGESGGAGINRTFSRVSIVSEWSPWKELVGTVNGNTNITGSLTVSGSLKTVNASNDVVTGWSGNIDVGSYRIRVVNGLIVAYDLVYE